MRHILIVEDNRETRLWLLGIVRAAFPGCRVDEAETRQQGIGLGMAGSYDLALIDLGLPDGSGLEVLRELHRHHPATVCIVATVMGDDAHIVAALAAGAQGYLLKEQPRERLILQLAQVTNGIPALSPSVARRIMAHFRLTNFGGETEGRLTEREREVLGLIARGLRIADVAVSLKVADGTVASHVKAIYRKLGISSRAEAALQATRMGLLDKGRQA